MAAERKYRPPALRALDGLLGRLPKSSRRGPVFIQSFPRRLLIVKAVGLGDGILIFSLARHLHRLYPEVEIGVLGCPPMLQAGNGESGIRIHRYDPREDGGLAMLGVYRDVRRAHYDAAIDFEPLSLVSAAFLWACRIPVRIGLIPPVPNPRARFFTHALDADPHLSTWNNFVSLVRLLEPRVKPDAGLLPLPCSSDTEASIERWWTSQIAPFASQAVALHLGTGERGVYRRWPLARFVEFAEKLSDELDDLAIVLTGTGADAPLIRAFMTSYTKFSADASDLGELEATAALLKRCELLVANDTGLMHLGAAMQTPTIGLFGPNSPTHWAPIGPNTAVIYATRLPCSPCIDTFRGRMPMQCVNAVKSQCMLDISVDKVLQRARNILKTSRRTTKSVDAVRASGSFQ